MKPFKKRVRQIEPKKPETYAFIDSQNLNLGTKKMGWKMDWRRFRIMLKEDYGVTKAYMFIGYMSENEQMYEYMHELGFLVVLKPTLDITATEEDKNKDDKDKVAVKGNVDAELVLYTMKELPNYAKAIIVSGDGDFYSLIEHLKNVNKLAYVMTPNWQYSSLLKPFEDQIIRLDKLKNKLAYHDRKNRRTVKK